MKTKLSILGALVAITGASHGAIALTGTALTGLSTLAPVGTLVLLVADSGGNGLFSGATVSGDLISSSVSPIALANASVTIGETFGGDSILGRGAVTSAGALPGGFSFDNVAGLQGKRFSLVYLPSLTSASTAVTAATTYGLVSGSDWILPAVNGGESFSFSSTDQNGATSFYRVTVASGVATNDTYTSSSGANLTLVPEPSAALLGAVGALGLLRRRRN
jgi:MYXO-CTERM domain-containing protein